MPQSIWNDFWYELNLRLRFRALVVPNWTSLNNQKINKIFTEKISFKFQLKRKYIQELNFKISVKCCQLNFRI